MSRLVASLLALHLLVPSAMAADNGMLEAGFGEADITPKLGKKPVFIAGFGENRKATAIHDPLMARAVVFRHDGKKVALVCLDLIGFGLPNVENVRKLLPDFHYVLVSSTHVHEGPDTIGLWGAGPLQSGVDPDYLLEVEKQTAKAVQAAAAACKRVTAALGTARAPELLHDGREPYIKHDELVALALRDSATAKPAGIVVQWNCHPETVNDKSTEITADYIATTVALLRAKHGCPVVYLTGTVGGLMTTMHVDIKDRQGALLPEGSVAKMERYGELLADVADSALRDAKALSLTPFDVRHRPIYLPLENKLYRLARQVGVLTREAYVWSGDSAKAKPARAEDEAGPLCTRSELAYLHLGDLEIAAIPGEIYPELVLGKVQDPVDPGADFPNAPIEPSIYGQLRGPHKMVIGLANDEIGYILPKRQWDEKPPFCYGRKKAQYGETNSLGPDTGPLLCEAFRDLVRRKK